MDSGSRRFRSYFLVSIFLFSLVSFGANSTQAAETNVPLDPWSFVDSNTDIRNSRITTAGSDLVISSFVENENTVRTKLYHPDFTNLPIILIYEETDGIIQSLEVMGESCEGADQCKLHFVFTTLSGSSSSSGSLRYALYEIDSINGSISEIIAPQSIVSRDNLRDAAIGIDSKGAVHITWTDSHDPSGILHNTDQIRYTMLQIIIPQFVGGMAPYADALISDTLLTTNYGSKGHSSIAIDNDDRVIVAWDDVRGSSVEIVFIMPTPYNGYMNGEWSDVCSVLYGGAYDVGSLPSLKEITDANGILLMETIYGLHDQTPSQANQNNCQGYNTNQRSRTTPLSVSDDSGGIRRLQDTIYNGQRTSVFLDEREHWGPGTTWACMSWKDANGNTGSQSNPPTSSDHRWNEAATRIVVPFGVEGPYQGDPAQNSDDRDSIEEAHRRCIDGETIVAPVYAYPVANPNDVFDNMLDLAWCPDNGVNTVTRSCPGTSSQTRNMSSKVIQWRQTNGGLDEQWNEISELANRGTRDIWMTALDPWGMISSTSSFVNGSSATIFDSNQNQYVERIGSSSTGNLVVINDTALVENDALSMNPRIAFDEEGHLHLVWTDGWTHSNSNKLPTEILHNRFDLPDMSIQNGNPNGLDSTSLGPFTTLVPTNVSVIESGTIQESWSDHNADLFIDSDGDIHVAWVDAVALNGEDTIVHATLTPPTSFPGANFEIIRIDVDNDGADNNGVRPIFSDMSGERPSVTVTQSGITTISYTSKGDCSFPGGNVYNLCIGRIAPSLHVIRTAGDENLNLEIEPGETEEINLEIAIRDGTGLAKLDIDLSSPLGIGCDDWSTTFKYTQNDSTFVPPVEDIVIGSVPLQITVTFEAPNGDDLEDGSSCNKRIIATDDGGMAADILLSASLVVNRTLDLRIMQSSIAIEQGSEDGITIEIENTGNVPIDVVIADPTTVNGRLDWQLPNEWNVQFIQNVRLNPGQSTSAYALIIVPLNAIAEDTELKVNAWIEQDSSPSIEEGSYAWDTFTVNVGIKRSGNIVLELFDTSAVIEPGECSEFEITIKKFHGDGEVVISGLNTVDNAGNFFVEYNLSDLDLEDDDTNSLPLTIMMNRDSILSFSVNVCSNDWAEAGNTYLMGIDVSLLEDLTIGDDIEFSTTILAVHDLQMTLLSDNQIEAISGERYEFRIAIQNEGNILEIINPEIIDFDELSGIGIQFAEDAPEEIEPGESADLVGFIQVNNDARAGLNNIKLRLNELSPEIEIGIMIPLRIDMEIELLGGNFGEIESNGEITWTFAILNNGNYPDRASLTLHEEGDDGIEAISNSQPLPGFIVSIHEGSLEDNEIGANIGIDTMGRAMLGEIEPGGQRIVRVHVVLDNTDYPSIETQRFGVKINSEHGGQLEGGDQDSSDGWIGPDYDENEQILLVEFKALDLKFGEITQTKFGNEVDITAELINLGNLNGENIVIIACPNVSPTMLSLGGCSSGEVKSIIPSISEMNGDEAGSRRITIRVDGTNSIDWSLQIDPENRLIDINRDNNLATITIEIEENKGIFGGLVNPSDENFMNLIIAGLIAIVGGLLLILLLIRVRTKRSTRKDRWMKESRAWASNDVPSAPPQFSNSVPIPPGLPSNPVNPTSNDPYSDLDDMNIGDLLGDLL